MSIIDDSKKQKIKTTIILLSLLYIATTIFIMAKNWDNLFYAVTHKEDIEWLQGIRDNAWEEKKVKMLEEKKQETESKEVGFVESKKKELPDNLKKLVKDTPIEEMSELIANNKYGVDPYLVIGIAKAESSLGTDFYHWKDYKNYNYWGIKPSGGIRQDGSYLKWYKNKEEAVNDICRLLKENYLNQGFNTIDKIVVKYVGNDSENWKSTVKSIVSLK